eukprot:m.191676 g.191676  ORF g.191676 m.191676 type:complete len:391 (+) comp18424_c0_seq1:47-1219(+)
MVRFTGLDRAITLSFVGCVAFIALMRPHSAHNHTHSSATTSLSSTGAEGVQAGLSQKAQQVKAHGVVRRAALDATESVTMENLAAQVIEEAVQETTKAATHAATTKKAAPTPSAVPYFELSWERPGTLSATSKDRYNIPKIVWQTFSTNKFSTKAKYLADVRALNPEHTFHLVNDSRMDDFMRQFDLIEGVREAYFSINPAIIAAKADVWRYAVLYQIGGVYIDIDSTCNQPLGKIAHNDDKGVVSWAGAWHRDTWKSWWDKVGYSPEMDQWCLFVAPGHPALKQALTISRDKINAAMEKKVEDMHELVLTTTGPKLFMQAVDSAKKYDEDFSLREMHEDFDGSCQWKVLGFRDKTLDEYAPKTDAVYYWDADKGTLFASARYRKQGLKR